jgi:hypothetical protein
MKHQTTQTINANTHIQQLKECLNSLSEKAFWQYAKFYGILPPNFEHDRTKASAMLLSIYETNEQNAQQAIRHLGNIPWKQVG